MENTLYYGDNLKVLREYIQDASVDLIYLDPPPTPQGASAFKKAEKVKKGEGK
jgi:DNA modification methylase